MIDSRAGSIPAHPLAVPSHHSPSPPMMTQDTTSARFTPPQRAPRWTPVRREDGMWHVVRDGFTLVMSDKRCNERCAEEVARSLNRIYSQGDVA